MSETYSLIKDEEETKRFIEKVLQPLKNDEVYITVLTARKNIVLRFHHLWKSFQEIL